MQRAVNCIFDSRGSACSVYIISCRRYLPYSSQEAQSSYSCSVHHLFSRRYRTYLSRQRQLPYGILLHTANRNRWYTMAVGNNYYEQSGSAPPGFANISERQRKYTIPPRQSADLDIAVNECSRAECMNEENETAQCGVGVGIVKSVRFTFVPTEVHLRPYTRESDKPALFYSAKDIRSFRRRKLLDRLDREQSLLISGRLRRNASTKQTSCLYRCTAGEICTCSMP